MEKNIIIGILYEYYQELLSEKQAEVIDQYYIEDLSLTEIADLHGISKQAVSQNIKRSEKALLDIEDKLKLYSKLSLIQKKLEDLDALIKTEVDHETYEKLHTEISLLIQNELGW